jgi:hypothetical protein
MPHINSSVSPSHHFNAKVTNHCYKLDTKDNGATGVQLDGSHV